MIKLPSEYLVETNTDKLETYHSYGDFYDMAISSLLKLNDNEALSVLEIGVSLFGKGSFHGFCEMPYVGKIVGIDTDSLVDPPDKGIFLQGNAYNHEMLNRVKEFAPFNLIIDDGSHRLEDWTFTLAYYLPLLANPGILAIEDLYSPCEIEYLEMAYYQHSQANIAGGRIGYIVRLS